MFGRKTGYNRQIRSQRTVPVQKCKEIGTVLLFCLLLPYVAATLSGRVGVSASQEPKESIFIVLQNDSGTEKIPLNTYLTGALAASIDGDSEEETLKAQAIILRTLVWEACQTGGDKNSSCVNAEELPAAYYSVWELQKSWAGDFDEKYGRLKRIVEETEGIIMTYRGIPIKASYFYVSAGTTRNGYEVYADGEYPYLRSTKSMEDLLCPDYGSKVLCPRSLFESKMKKLFALPDTAAINLADLDVIRDSAGYVSLVSYAGQTVPGELVREVFDLKSSHFSWEEQEQGILFRVQGIGHGLGFSQYGANEMAGRGDSFDVILEYYFQDIEIEKY